MSGTLPKVGAPVRIKNGIMAAADCAGFLVLEEYIRARRPGALGKYWGFAAGAGGDVWWVKHEDNQIGAYMYDEVEVLSEPS